MFVFLNLLQLSKLTIGSPWVSSNNTAKKVIYTRVSLVACTSFAAVSTYCLSISFCWSRELNSVSDSLQAV